MTLKIIGSIILIASTFNCYAQTDTSDIISVSVDIAGQGNLEFHDGEDYYAILKITNNKDSVICFNIMSCSWKVSWIFDNDSIYLCFPDPGCDINSPEKIKLGPNKSIKFYGLVATRKKELQNKNFRLGFVMLTQEELLRQEDLMNYGTKESVRLKNKKIFWSNEQKLENPWYHWEIEK